MAETKLIKSSERVREHGEVFTPDFLVERMLDQFPEEAWEPTKTWLEPTCGNGQFILGILRRKLSHGHPLLRALDTTFGCDIMSDNVSECHVRIYREIVIPQLLQKKAISGQKFADIMRWKSVCLVENNIRPTKDALKEDFARWQRFAMRPSKFQDGMKSKVQSILHLLDRQEELPQDMKTKTDKRLFRELFVFNEAKG